VSVYLAASGKLFAGLALFVWGAVELFIVDKTLRPKLVGGPIKLPFLPTFFGLIANVTVGPDLVLDDHRLSGQVLQGIGIPAHHQIAAAASRIRADDLNGPIGIVGAGERADWRGRNR